MAVIVKGADQLEGGADGQGERTYRLSYKSSASAPPTVVDAIEVTRAVVAYSGLDIGSPYLNDFQSYCQSINSRCLKRLDGPFPTWQWETLYTFSSKVDRDHQGGPTKEKDPTKRPARVSIHIEKFDIVAAKDKWGIPVTNSAGDPIIRQQKDCRVIFKWSKYVNTWNWENCQRAKTEHDFTLPGDFINHPGYMFSRNFYGWVPGGAVVKGTFGNGVVRKGAGRIDDIRAEFSYENDGCVKVDIDVSVDQNLHYDSFIDQGFFHFATANPYTTDPDPDTRQTPTARPSSPSAVSPLADKIRFYDRAGFTTTPQLLDGNGNPLATDQTQPVTLDRQYYFWRDWNIGQIGDYFN